MGVGSETAMKTENEINQKETLPPLDSEKLFSDHLRSNSPFQPQSLF